MRKDADFIKPKKMVPPQVLRQHANVITTAITTTPTTTTATTTTRRARIEVSHLGGKRSEPRRRPCVPGGSRRMMSMQLVLYIVGNTIRTHTYEMRVASVVSYACLR